MFEEHLSYDEIQRLHQTVIALGLADQRATLFAGISQAFVAGLQRSDTPSMQLLLDLNKLNATEKLANSSVPFVIWLRNARMLTSSLPQSEIFEKTVQILSSQTESQASTLGKMKHAVGRTKVGNNFGTCFLVSEKHLLTCAHCLHDEQKNFVSEVDIRFEGWELPADQLTRRASVVWPTSWPPEQGADDVVLLELQESIPNSVLPLALGGSASVDTAFETWGFPLQTPLGHRVVGIVRDPNARINSTFGGVVSASQLETTTAKDAVNGLSGSPLMVGGLVVGLISNQLKQWAVGNATSPAFETLYALPISVANHARNQFGF